MARRHRRRDAPGRPARGVVVTTLVAFADGGRVRPGRTVRRRARRRGHRLALGHEHGAAERAGRARRVDHHRRASLRIAWTVTNASGGDLVVFDDRRPDEAAGSERYGAFVTAGHDDATVEVARRLFPVPDDLEGVRAYGVNATPPARGRQRPRAGR
jgi:hypothetical protein